MIAIIDYGAGNIQSVYKALKFIGADCKVADNKNEIMSAAGAVLPGVGSFGEAMNTMANLRLKDAVTQFIYSGRPFLGICLGLQLLFPESEESPGAAGLNIYKGNIKKIPNGNGSLKIPHIGWNSLEIEKKNGIFRGIEDGAYVYFVHSYYLEAEDKNIVAATTEYGAKIDAAVEKDNVIATQFHPEKSGKTGLRILNNFVELIG